MPKINSDRENLLHPKVYPKHMNYKSDALPIKLIQRTAWLYDTLINPYRAKFLKWNNPHYIFGTFHYHFRFNKMRT